MSDKRFGIFECSPLADHELTAGAPSHLQVAHSRWNDLAESDLVSCGYRMLTRAKDGGTDSFAKKRNSLLVFFQGHLEYEANTLLLEYRRDIGRYLKGERNSYPLMPESYFDPDTTDKLTGLRDRAMHERRPELLDDFPTERFEKNLIQTWRSAAALVYRNWLTYLCARKKRQPAERQNRNHVAREAELAPESHFAAAD